MALKKNGGVIQIVAFADYVKADPKERAPGDRRAAGGVRARRRPRRRRRARGAAAPAALPRTAARSRTPPRRRQADAPRPRRGGRGGATRRSTALSPDRRAEFDRRLAEIDRQVAGGRPRHREGLRRSHRLRREADRHRPRRHLVGLRRRRRRRRLEQRRRERSTSRWSSCAAATPKSRSARSGAATCCACGARSRRWLEPCNQRSEKRVAYPRSFATRCLIVAPSARRRAASRPDAVAASLSIWFASASSSPSTVTAFFSLPVRISSDRSIVARADRIRSASSALLRAS